MSRNRALQADAALVELRAGAQDVVTEPSQVAGCWTAQTNAADVPARCTDLDVMRGLGFGRATFYRLKAKGAFRFLEFTPAIDGAATQYSGHLIVKWLRGELRTPGAPRVFFGKAGR